jgi:hypothetical protein
MNRRSIGAITAAALLLVACSDDDPKNRSATAPCPEGDGYARYFPQVTFWSDDLGDAPTPENPLFYQYLTAMNEPPLACGGDGRTEAFRFLWIGRDPLSIRASRQGNNASLTVVELERGTGQSLGHLSRSFTKKLQPAEWDHLIDSLHRPLGWPDFVNTGANDWVIEGVSGRKYIMFAGIDDNAKKAASIFLDLAGLSARAGMLGP